ncbi:MFS transporter [Reyranella sp. MMS21-HV4-11]|uniref:MFS transporter n=1 Tax=Reyranella humidisoli TaxID=2849149 RepID=A0ABS6IME4_9HYPH|nr:MFS transporter [Reyranella sp. MMS21-HV4-11]MBU8875769.1 MFS transporter [Reyranella sp. MMS21-HV4-11]
MTDNTMAAGAAPVSAPAAPAPSASANNTTFAVILSLSFCHLLNDMMQSLVPALYPILKDSYELSFGQIGFITLAFQCTASMLQPVVGMYTDKKPQPYSLMVGMGFTLVGLLLMSQANSYPLILLAAALIGMGSSVFHPEASRVARMAAGGRYGLAQSLFQVGGNMGSAAGPLLAAFIVVPAGQQSIVWFSAAALVAMIVLFQVGHWYKANRTSQKPGSRKAAAAAGHVTLSKGRVGIAVAILVALLFSKNVYSASLGSYFTFYLIQKFGVEVQTAQLFLFAFLVGIVVGTILGGVVGDRLGRIPVMWFSILGALPFALMLPYANLFWTGILAVAVAIIMASAFSAILVYAQELLPGRVGLVAGMFFGVSFGLGGLGAAALGEIADHAGIEAVYKVTPFLLLLGLLTAFLPKHPSAPKLPA